MVQDYIKKVETLYDINPQIEWERLKRYKTEYLITLNTIMKYIPHPPAKIIDIGGGPGRYSFELAKLGYEVTLVDLSNENIKFAKNKSKELNIKLKDYIHGNALDLSFIPNNYYDVVLLLGPLYHILEESNRIKALKESIRILKNDKYIFTSYISITAHFRDIAIRDPERLYKKKEFYDNVLKTGVYLSEKGSTHFTNPDKILKLIKDIKIQFVELLGCEGIISGIDEKINKLNDKEFESWLKLNYDFCKEPYILGNSDHFLCVAKNK
jgi:ubiquinone/menaquinone biosynthesis C-methylase UbiE